MHRCYVPEASGGTITLTGDDAHHVQHVLRLGPGAALRVFDGRGHEWDACLMRASRSGVTIRLEAPVAVNTEARIHLTLAIGLLKGDQMSEVVRDATALGVARIIPVISRYTVARARVRGEVTSRWQRIAASAAAQSGRAVIPSLSEPVEFDEMLPTADQPLLLCAEPVLGEAADPLPPPPSRATLLVGPEGGWASEEVDAAQRAGALIVTLGPRRLRAELAPIVAIASLWTRWNA